MYVLEADPDVVLKLKQEKEKERLRLADLNQTVQEEDNDPDFTYHKSSASTYVSNIESFTFGGLTSRFWIMRKHFMTMSQEQLKNLPFYSWQCLTLSLGEREVDIVIQDEKQMNYFLRFLIQSLCTVDGKRGSAKKILEIMILQESQNYLDTHSD